MTIKIEIKNEGVDKNYCGQCRFLNKDGKCVIFNEDNYFCMDKEQFERNTTCLEHGNI